MKVNLSLVLNIIASVLFPLVFYINFSDRSMSAAIFALVSTVTISCLIAGTRYLRARQLQSILEAVKDSITTYAQANSRDYRGVPLPLDRELAQIIE